MSSSTLPRPQTLTLPEGAALLNEELGVTEWTVWHIVECATRGEISIFAPWNAVVRLTNSEPGPNEDKEILTVIGAYSAVPHDVAQSLLLTRHSALLTGLVGRLSDHFDLDEQGRPTWMTGKKWTLAEGQTAPRFSIDECRIKGYAIGQLVTKYSTATTTTTTTTTPITNSAAESLVEPAASRKVMMNGGREHIMTRAVELARSEVADADSMVQVWARLEALADDGKPPEPLIAASPDGLKYRHNGQDQCYTKDALKGYLKRHPAPPKAAKG